MARTKDELLEQIIEHFTARVRAGKNPSIDGYKRKFPELADEIEDMLTSVAMIEGLKQTEPADSSMSRRIQDVLNLGQLGDYRIVRELGRGGMGVVFEAVHESLGRRVAIKVLPVRTIDDEKYIERFRREAQAAANLHHTNIVSVFGVGQHDGHHYYVMEYVDGRGLNQVLSQLRGDLRHASTVATQADSTQVIESIDDSAPSFELNGQPSSQSVQPVPGPSHERRHWRWAADLVAQVADALAYAHDQQMLHRDVKPANLLLDGQGKIWITDFGLVKNLTNQTLTRTGDILGTPQYMAPEAFEGRYDVRSETYCLGLTLYELVTLKPAYAELSTHELIRQITTTDPVAPRKVHRRIPRDLNTIIQTAIARDPEHRYATAGEFRDDLRSFLAGQPIRARRSDPLEQAVRWARRNPLVASLVGLLGLAVFAIAVIASVAYVKTTNALDLARLENEKLQLAKSEIEAKEADLEEQNQLLAEQYRRADKNIALTLAMFEEMFNQIIAKGASSDLNIEFDDAEGFEAFSGMPLNVSTDDAAFLERMLVFYERFAEQNEDNQDLLRESAKAYRKVGDIYQLAGNIPEATSAYEQAIRVYQSFLDQTPSDDLPQTIEWTLAIARVRNDLAVMLNHSPRERRRAIELLRKSKEELDQLNTRHPDVRFELARTLYHLASRPLMARAGMTDGGEGDSFRDRALARIKKLGRALPGDRAPQRMETMRLKAATEALSLLDELILSDPDEPLYRFYHAKTLIQKASVSSATERPSVIQRAIDELAQLQSDFPQNLDYRYTLALVLFSDHRRTGEERLKAVVQANEIAGELCSKVPANVGYREMFARTSFELALIYLDRGDGNQSLESLTKASGVLQDLLKETNEFRFLGVVLRRRKQYANRLLEQKRFDDAANVLNQTIAFLESPALTHLIDEWGSRVQEHRQQIASSRSQSTKIIPLDRLPDPRRIKKEISRLLSDQYRMLADVYRRMENSEASRRALEKARQLQETRAKTKAGRD